MNIVELILKPIFAIPVGSIKMAAMLSGKYDKRCICKHCGVYDELATSDDEDNIYCIHCKKKIEEE